MIKSENIANQLCSTFCEEISVNPVPVGYAISTPFKDQSGDRIGFFLVESGGGYRVEDDGEYIAKLIASGIAIDHGQRADILETILRDAKAYWDKDSYEIKSQGFSEDQVGSQVTSFLSALIRIRDLELVTREVVRSTFKEDVMSALENRFSDLVSLEEQETVDKSLGEYPVDLVVRPKSGQGKVGALYFANSNAKLAEAELLHMEAKMAKRTDFKVMALIEDPEMSAISRKKFQRAQNWSIPMPIWAGDEDAVINRISNDLELSTYQ